MEELNREIIRCKKCLMPLSAPGVNFSEDGICNACVDYQPVQVQGDEELLKVVRNFSYKSQPYDCIVPISGGLDSLYTIFYLKNKLGLSCIAVNYDTGLNSKSAKTNLAWIEKVMKIPIVYIGIDKSETKNIILNSLRALMNYEPKYMQAALCRHCGFGIRAAVYNEMVNRGLPSIWGMHTFDKLPFRYCLSLGNRRYFFQKTGNMLI